MLFPTAALSFQNFDGLSLFSARDCELTAHIKTEGLIWLVPSPFSLLEEIKGSAQIQSKWGERQS